MRNMQPQYINELHATDGERSSLRSSEDGGSGSPPPGGEDSEKYRLMHKIECIKEKLIQINIEREGDVENYLSKTDDSMAQRGADNNPQISRIRKAFEKKNTRHTQDIDGLQKKLAAYQLRLDVLENGGHIDTSRSSNVISTVGQGIRRTGANLKGMKDSVMAAPIELAQRLKSTFGSADNLNESNGGGHDDSRVGQSTFYATSEHGSARSSTKKAKSSTLPAGMKMDMATGAIIPATQQQTPLRRPPDSKESSHNNSRQYNPEDHSLPSFVWDALSPPSNNSDHEELVKQLIIRQDQLDNLRAMNESNEKEISFLTKALNEERFKTTRLEESLNETIELHQAEFMALKQEQKNIANRLDYQYNDRFKRVEESVESVQDQIYRMDTSFKDTMEARFGKPAIGQNIMLSGANVLVELLKLLLYFIATMLDFIRPLTGSRNKAGVVLTVIICSFILFQNVDVFALIVGLFTRKNSTISSPPLPTAPITNTEL